MKSTLQYLEDRSIDDLLIYRGLLLAGIFIIPLLGYLIQWFVPEAIEPMIDRYILSGIFALVVGASYTSRFVRNRFQLVINMLIYLVSFDLLYSLYVNNFRMEYFVEIMATLFAIIALGFKSKRALWAYLIFINVSLVCVALLTENTSFNKAFTVSVLSMISGIVAFASGLRMDDQKKVEETEATWRSVFKDAGDHIIVIDKERRTQLINFTAEGHSKEDMIGIDILNFMPPGEKEKIREKINQALNGEKVTYSTSMVSPLNNQTMHYLSTASPLKRNGEVIGVVFMARDITELKNTQEQLELQNKALIQLQHELKESEGRIKRFLEGLPVGVYAIDKEGKPFYANDKAVEILGKGIDPKITQDNLAEVYQAYIAGTGHFYPSDKMPISKALQGETITIDDMEIQKEGERIPLEATGRPIYNSQGEIEYAMAIFSDITERKKSMKLLEDFTVALDTSACITRTDKDGIITYANEYFCKLSGYSAEELIGKTHRVVNSGHHSREFFENMWNAILKGRVWKGEVKNKAKNGKFFWQMESIVPVTGEDGQIREFISVSANVTRHRELERSLRKAKKEADKAAQAKANFLATMSHEIRTPMNAVIGMTGLMKETELSEEQLDYVETIKLGGENLMNVINDILDYSKIESGRLELEDHEFNLAESIEDVLDLVAANAVKKEIELMYDIRPDVPRIIKCDSTRLRQVLTNLLSNAIKFTSDRGEVVVSTENDDEISNYKILKFAIKDTGIGIPQEKLDVLFKPFSQVDASTTRKYGGTGLGLAICKKLVNFMGGDIWVESKVGEGSTFYFTIRVKAIEAGNQPKLKDLSGVSVLIVDDNETNLKILSKQCECWGMEVTATSDPELGLRFVRESLAYDLVILDMQMPGMNGIELTKAIRKYYSKEELPIIMLTSIGCSLSPKEKEMLSALTSKPVKQSRLNDILCNQLKKHEEGEIKMLNHNNKEKNNGTLRILVAEDNPINQKVISRILEKLGYQGDIAGNGFEALDALNFKRYDLIFMDVQMPEMDGLEATRRIKKAKNGSTPVIIGMTAHAMKTDRDECLEAGMNDYLAKPVQLHIIDETIKKWFADESIIKAS